MRVFAKARGPAKTPHFENSPNITCLTLDPTSAPSAQSAFRVLEAQTGGALDVRLNDAGQVVTIPTLGTNLETAKSMH